MTRITELTETAADALVSVLAGLGHVDAIPAAEWAESVAEVERLGRLADAARVAVAAAAVSAGRSLPAAAEAIGARSGADALAGCAGISEPEARRRIIEEAILAAGAKATPERSLAWIMLETNRETFRHELTVRYWPGDGEPHLLAQAQAHGAWVEWF